MGLKIRMAKEYQGVFLLLLCSISLCFSAPGGNPNCQVDGSEVPVCDGSSLFFSHQTDCGKFWECGPDLKPCLFECPPISEDIGGGTLFFNIELTTCDWPQNVDCQNVATTEALTAATTEAVTDATTEVVTDATTEAVTEATTDTVTDATTEALTDGPTDAVTDATTEAVTEGTTEAVTDATTEAVTEATTETVTDATTEDVTDGPTDAVTDATTEAMTEGTTEAVTDATTESVTNVTTDAVTDATTEAVTDATTQEITDVTTDEVTDGITTSQDLWNGNCVLDDSERLLDDMTTFPNTNTPNMCIESCYLKGYLYAGVQYKSQCFCGDTAPPPSRVVSDEECNGQCTGDENKICGGTWRMNVFSIY